MQFLENEIYEYTKMVWETQLRLPLSRSEAGAEDPPPDTIRCAVQIFGGWNGWVVMDLAPQLVERAAQIFFDESHPPTPDDLEDTLKELANLVGGNLKNLMPQPAKLMFPVVSLDGQALHFPDTRVQTRLAFSSETLPFEIRLLEHPPP